MSVDSKSKITPSGTDKFDKLFHDFNELKSYFITQASIISNLIGIMFKSIENLVCENNSMKQKIMEMETKIEFLDKQVSSSCMSGSKNETVTTTMYDPGIRQNQNPVLDQLYTTIDKKDDKSSSVDFPFYNMNMVQKVPVSGNIAVLAAASANGVTQTDKTSYHFDVTAPFNNYALGNQMSLSTSASFKCDVCGAGFTHASMLDHHKKSAHPQEPPSFTCSKIVKKDDKSSSVDFPFYNMNMVQKVPVSANIAVLAAASANGVTQTDKTSYHFDVTAPFNNNYALVNQMSLSTSASFKCDVCGAEFTHVSMLDHHKKSVHPQEPPSFTCSTCGSCFPRVKDIKVHRSTVHKQCFSCGADVAPQTVKSKKSRFIKCVNCSGGNCSNHTPQENEIESNDNNLSPEQTAIMKGYYPYPVKKRGMAYNTISNTPNKPFYCNICGGSFSYYSSFWSHKRLHSGDKPFKCEICRLSFAKAGYLKSHSRVHAGEKPFKCGICGMQFSQSSNHKIHERVHNGERPYQCEVCHKTFARHYTLMSHQRIHTGEKPYLCDICGSAFNQATHFKAHAKVHTDEKPCVCDICGVGFSDRLVLKLHRNIHKKYARQQSDAAAAQTVTPPSQELDL